MRPLCGCLRFAGSAPKVRPMRKILMAAAVLAMIPTAAAAQPDAPTTTPSLTFIQSPDVAGMFTADDRGPCGVVRCSGLDPSATFIGLDVGAHQPVVKLICHAAFS